MYQEGTAVERLPATKQNFRYACGMFATGVTVVATGDGEDIHAMTANAVTSLSLDPLLFLFCVNKSAGMAKYMENGQGFSINVLRLAQKALSNYFAGAWKDETPPSFEFVSWKGGPLLKDCAAAIACELHKLYDGGDHYIVVGKVIELYRGEEPVEPLLFYRGRYHTLAEQ